MSGNRYSYSRENSNKKRYINEAGGKKMVGGRTSAASRRWVRSTSSVSSTTSSQGVIPLSDSEKNSETTNVLAVIPSEPKIAKGGRYAGNSITKNGEGPILRGGPPPSSRVWRRSASTTSSQLSQEYLSDAGSTRSTGDDGSKASREEIVDGKLFLDGKNDDASTFSKTTASATATDMKRQSTNKLVLAGKTENPSAQSKKEELKTFERGENKLVLNNKNKLIGKESGSANSQELPSNGSRKRSLQSILSVDKSHTWRRRRYESAKNGDKAPVEKSFQGMLASSNSEKGFDLPNERRGQRRGGNIKRIQLNAIPSSNSDEESDGGDGDERNKEKKNREIDESTSETPVLTDFAYREVSFNSRRGRKKPMTISRISSNTEPPKNMGLVRVKPNPKQAPTICPVILLGISCTDPNCKKRHDLSRESVTPLCSYFQRNGQCLKGEDCPFRHVKVNARAEVCPSFSYLGYCEDPNCTMKHVRQKKQQHIRRPFSLSLKKDAGVSSSLTLRKK